MKITEQHVSDKLINDSIAWLSVSEHPFDQQMVLALLELKQRRAEARQRENDGR
jgi:hypothetical protein